MPDRASPDHASPDHASPDGVAIDLVVNGTARTVRVQPGEILLDVLRDKLELRGPKECCVVGECGACTVAVNGETVNACLMLAVEAEGASVVTVEGLGGPGKAGMTPLQHAFLEHGAVQCGFCIPGMLMSAQALLDREPDPDDAAIREALSGNLCRCAGYFRMFEAVKSAARAGRAPNSGSPAAGTLAEPQVAVHGGVGHNDDTLIGRSVERVGGPERVGGTQAFLADIAVPDLLHVALVKLDVASARLLAIDVSAARVAPGVADVITAADLSQPVPRFGPVFNDRPILANGEVKYHGEPVAAVVAESRQAAADAAALVRVEFEILPPVVTIEQALAPEAPLVQEPGLRPGDPLAQTNILRERRYGWGDVDAAQADLVVEDTYTFPMVTHFAIEPHGFMAKWERESDGGGLTVWSPVQHPFLLQTTMARLFDLPLTRVRVLAPDPGGGFGGKQNPKFEPLVAVLARRTGRPCRLLLSLEETFQAVRRASTEVHVRTGFSRAGDIVFQDIRSDFLLGAYVDIGERVMTKASYLGVGPYRVPNARIHSRALLSHTTPSSAFRGFGTPQMNWAIESNINAGARRLGLDGLEIRLRNLATRGDAVVPGDVPADGAWPESLKRAAEAVGWYDPLPPGRGRGIAVGIKSGATTGLSNSTIRLLADGSAIVYAGTSDMGQGARTIFAQLAAEALGVPLAKVSVVMGDTSVVPFDLQTSASRSTVFMGTAIGRACEDIHAQLREMAVELTGAAPEAVRIGGGMIALAAREMSIPDFVAAHLRQWTGELIGNGRMRKPHVAGHPLGGGAAFYEFNCTAFEVEVDRDTGEIIVHKHVTVGDVGKALNPVQVEAQDEGAAIMGLGHTLMEHIILDRQGRIRNLGAIDYRIPTSRDLPTIMQALMIENQDGPGPYGAKGVSEGGLLCTSPALAEAVTDATGARFRALPLTPERVWRALRDLQTAPAAGRWADPGA